MDWKTARMGIPTASRFDQILTSKRLEYSASAPRLRNHLLAEWLLGYPIDTEADSK